MACNEVCPAGLKIRTPLFSCRFSVNYTLASLLDMHEKIAGSNRGQTVALPVFPNSTAAQEKNFPNR